MKIKNQGFNLIDPEFTEFSIDAEFEIEISIDQPCFANCVLVAFGWIDADDGLYPYCTNFKIRTEKGIEKAVELDSKLEHKIDSAIDDVFQKQYEAYCEKENEENAISTYESSFLW